MRVVIGIAALVIAAGAAVLIGRGLGPQGTFVLSGARAAMSVAEPASVDVFVTLQNGAQPDRLISASSADAQSARVLAQGVQSTIPIPAQSAASLSLDGAFVRLSNMSEHVEEGQLIPISLTFEVAGTLSTRAVVVAPTDPHAEHYQKTLMDPPEVAEGSGAPGVSIDVAQQPDGTTKVTLVTSRFTFDPDMPEPVHVPGHGHAHLYLDGFKVARMHEAATTIGVLLPGTYTLTAALNSNDHRAYMDESGPVQASATFTVD